MHNRRTANVLFFVLFFLALIRVNLLSFSSSHSILRLHSFTWFLALVFILSNTDIFVFFIPHHTQLFVILLHFFSLNCSYSFSFRLSIIIRILLCYSLSRFSYCSSFLLLTYSSCSSSFAPSNHSSYSSLFFLSHIFRILHPSSPLSIFILILHSFSHDSSYACSFLPTLILRILLHSSAKSFFVFLLFTNLAHSWYLSSFLPSHIFCILLHSSSHTFFVIFFIPPLAHSLYPS